MRFRFSNQQLHTQQSRARNININKYIRSNKSDPFKPTLTMSEGPSPTLATHAHAAYSPAAAVEPAVIADIDDINVSPTNNLDQVEADRRRNKAASRRCKWVSKAAAGMAATIQLTYAETSLVVAWYRRVVELEKGFLPHDNC
ncbi:hypothetical protein FIBSPDRAFT_857771 [Athelia psychrophila]|uniref:Uncharacterized protein n=1 Tax=Athelia psychrophila TaxID=1759441 RepID=A0A166MH38_9AGAM|nr:hypothetical protein FIBSPDRAFT_857771 [Fibularhizoctonia sp. CBS 109695]